MDKQLNHPQRRHNADHAACNLNTLVTHADIVIDPLADIHAGRDELTFQPRETIFRAQTPASRVIFIRSGFVKLVKYSHTGAQRIVRIVTDGGILGMESLFSSSFEHTAVAISQVTAGRIPADQFRSMVHANPALQRHLLECSCRTLGETETWLSDITGGNSSTRERLARLLLRLRDGDSNRIHRFSLEDIGAMLGVAIETACRILSELIRSGTLTKCRTGAATRYYLADIAALERVATGAEGRSVTAELRRANRLHSN